MRPFNLTAGTPVILYLQAPKEKVWGVLLSVDPAGIVVRGLDLAVFDDWLRQEARHEEALIGLTTLFYPMNRIERMEREETVGPILSYADRFAREVGRTVRQVLGLDDSRRREIDDSPRPVPLGRIGEAAAATARRRRRR